MQYDHHSGRTALLTSKRCICILYIYSTNIGTEYFKHGIHSPFFPPQNAVCFINLTYLVPVLFTFYTQSVLKLKKNNSGAKRLISSNFIFRCRTLGLKFFYALSLQKCSIAFYLSLLVSKFLMHILTYIHCVGGKQWQTTPKNFPRMQCARAIPVT